MGFLKKLSILVKNMESFSQEAANFCKKMPSFSQEVANFGLFFRNKSSSDVEKRR